MDAGAAALRSLRDVDSDRYLATLYAPADKRADLATLYLFNAEIAAIRDRVHEPLPGEIRIQWWRDALASGDAGGHPLAGDLLDVMRRHRLPGDAFDRMLEARIFDLYDDPMPARGDLEGYLGDTASALIQLVALVLDGDAAPRWASAAGHGGCAQGIAGLLRLLPVHRARGQCYLPADMLASVGTDRSVQDSEDREAAGRAVSAMAALGIDHAKRFETAAHGLPAVLRPAFLPVAPAPAYLARAAALGAGAFERTVAISALRRHGIFLRRAARGWS
jgi:phytoene synthase